MSSHKPFLIIVSAPSGSGKSTILKKLVESIDGLVFSVSHTTRSKREYEIQGRDYHFITSAEFLTMENDSEFIESATVHTNSYGTSFSSLKKLLSSGSDVLLDIDVQGAHLVKSDSSFDYVSIFILPPSLHELEKRLRKRNTESDSDIEVRLSCAVREMLHVPSYDYAVVNDDLDATVCSVVSIVKAERLRSFRSRFSLPV